MTPIRTVNEVFEAVQQAKAGAPDFCTNFFPVQRRLQEWIDHGELAGEIRDSVSFFFRRDRDFHHLYFCAASLTALKREVAALPEMNTEPMVLDIVGSEAQVTNQLPVWESMGCRRYTRLYRMARTVQPTAGDPQNSDAVSKVTFAEPGDSQGILNLLETAFDRYGEQIPTLYEVESAVESRQVLVAKHDGSIAGLLYFETQGFTSTLRFWAVAAEYRALGFGSLLMRKYFATQNTVRRFNLWVAMDNLNAVQKYSHYGYTADGLVDYVLANQKVRS